MSAGMSRDFSKEKSYKVFDGKRYYFYGMYSKLKSAEDWAELNTKMGRKYRIVKDRYFHTLYCTRS